MRIRVPYAAAIRASFVIDREVRGLSRLEAGVLAAIAYDQPITCADLSERFGREIGRDLIAPGLRAPKPGPPFSYVTTRRFLEMFGFETLRDLPDLEGLQDVGLQSKDAVLGEGLLGEFRTFAGRE